MRYINTNEQELSDKKYFPLNVAFLMIRCGEFYLLKRDSEGGHWELPATEIDDGETSRECIIRNYSEKYCFNDSDLELLGVAEVLFEKTELRLDPKPEYLVLFEVVIEDKDNILKQVDENLHCFYKMSDDITPFCSLCRNMIEYRHSTL